MKEYSEYNEYYEDPYYPEKYEYGYESSDDTNPNEMSIAAGSGYRHDGKCCPHVVPKKKLMDFILAIGVVTIVLNIQIQNNLPRKKRKRRSFKVLTPLEVPYLNLLRGNYIYNSLVSLEPVNSFYTTIFKRLC